jgi:hypothetical protein
VIKSKLQSVKSVLAILICGLFLSLNCLSNPMIAFGFINTTQPNHRSNLPIVQPAQVLKSGESCSWGSAFLVWVFYFGGGGSIAEAQEKGGIRKIAVVDTQALSILFGLFYQECVIVWGE